MFNSCHNRLHFLFDRTGFPFKSFSELDVSSCGLKKWYLTKLRLREREDRDSIRLQFRVFFALVGCQMIEWGDGNVRTTTVYLPRKKSREIHSCSDIPSPHHHSEEGASSSTLFNPVILIYRNERYYILLCVIFTRCWPLQREKGLLWSPVPLLLSIESLFLLASTRLFIHVVEKASFSPGRDFLILLTPSPWVTGSGEWLSCEMKFSLTKGRGDEKLFSISHCETCFCPFTFVVLLGVCNSWLATWLVHLLSRRQTLLLVSDIHFTPWQSFQNVDRNVVTKIEKGKCCSTTTPVSSSWNYFLWFRTFHLLRSSILDEAWLTCSDSKEKVALFSA